MAQATTGKASVDDVTDGEDLPVRPTDPVRVPYDDIVPPDKPYDEYNYAQRRSILLDRVIEVGHPAALNQTYRELADEFGVSKTTIHDDMRVLAAWVGENLDRDHVHVMDAVFHGAVRELMDEGDYVEAAEVGSQWYEWLADMGEVDRVADKVDLDATVRSAGDADAYRIIDDDEVVDVEARDVEEGEDE